MLKQRQPAQINRNFFLRMILLLNGAAIINMLDAWWCLHALQTIFPFHIRINILCIPSTISHMHKCVHNFSAGPQAPLRARHQLIIYLSSFSSYRNMASIRFTTKSNHCTGDYGRTKLPWKIWKAQAHTRWRWRAGGGGDMSSDERKMLHSGQWRAVSSEKRDETKQQIDGC